MHDHLLLAHSAPQPGLAGEAYEHHVARVHAGALERADDMLRYASADLAELRTAIDDAATYHDLGKLDPDNQAALHRGRSGRPPWDHVDAGVAHTMAGKDRLAAWLIRAHHAPGLPEYAEHFDPDDPNARRLRGRRGGGDHPAQIARTDEHLARYLADHARVVGAGRIHRQPMRHGLSARLALSCLVDADHTASAFFDTGAQPPRAAEPRWEERLAHLCRYVADLPGGRDAEERARNDRRRAFFETCLESRVSDAMVACEGPVGLGKTTAVTAYLMQRAHAEGLRRLIVVAPFTNVLNQTACRLREALVLDGERADDVVAVHHHRADFESLEARALAALWRAPVVLTTAVSFFETLAACAPGALRKLHAVPGSAIFLDEAHAALPAQLWPQNWRWLTELCSGWSCRIVLASGSLARFWEDPQVIAPPMHLPELLPPQQALDVLDAERRRVRYRRLDDGRVLSVPDLVRQVGEAAGPRLVVLNTVQSAAVVAREMKDAQADVMHLSSALVPRDRDRVLSQVDAQLRSGATDWTLVATSSIEAGVDLSFRSAFRERFSVASLIQIGGRVNRNSEHTAAGGGAVYDFAVDGPGITRHPGTVTAAGVLRDILASGGLEGVASPADIVSRAMREELERGGGLGMNPLRQAEQAHNYPATAMLGRVIAADTRIVVVDAELKRKISDREPVSFRDLLEGSVQLWATRISTLGLPTFPAFTGRDDLHIWNDEYDAEFLGIMHALLRTQAFITAGGGVI